jgi:hypothetical protein
MNDSGSSIDVSDDEVLEYGAWLGLTQGSPHFLDSHHF